MEKATKRQILSGLRIGGSLGAFLIGGMLMGDGLGRILGAAGSHEVVWTDWIGWVELVLAAAILLLTAPTWLMLLAGYLLFGALKSLVLVGTGGFPSHGFSTRVEPLALVLYCVATLMLLFRFAENPPTVLDRVALTVYLFCLWPAATTSAFSWWQGVGLGALLASWCVFRWRMWKDRDRRDCPAHGAFGEMRGHPCRRRKSNTPSARFFARLRNGKPGDGRKVHSILK